MKRKIFSHGPSQAKFSLSFSGSMRARKGEGDRRGAVGCRRAHDERPITDPRRAFFRQQCCFNSARSLQKRRHTRSLAPAARMRSISSLFSAVPGAATTLSLSGNGNGAFEGGRCYGDIAGPRQPAAPISAAAAALCARKRWQCSRCTLINEDGCDSCATCGSDGEHANKEGGGRQARGSRLQESSRRAADYWAARSVFRQ
jgi:hypothetical protein